MCRVTRAAQGDQVLRPVVRRVLVDVMDVEVAAIERLAEADKRHLPLGGSARRAAVPLPLHDQRAHCPEPGRIRLAVLVAGVASTGLPQAVRQAGAQSGAESGPARSLSEDLSARGAGDVGKRSGLAGRHKVGVLACCRAVPASFPDLCSAPSARSIDCVHRAEAPLRTGEDLLPVADALGVVVALDLVRLSAALAVQGDQALAPAALHRAERLVPVDRPGATHLARLLRVARPVAAGPGAVKPRRTEAPGLGDLGRNPPERIPAPVAFVLRQGQVGPGWCIAGRQVEEWRRERSRGRGCRCGGPGCSG